ncbi:TonB-dependent receptor [Sphingomonas sp.]|uniref:TonB-dependent receptor n=1 Tax=Sphingomonas sp. TaxID=28214 RepID=UPI002DD64346|nr:TonB-dependent receptor [Sphingomonas sp.]
MYKRMTLLLAGVAAVTLNPAASAQDAPATAPAEDPAPDHEGEEPDSTGEVTVTGQRERGSVPGDVKPEQVLRASDIRAYGVSSIADLVAELAPQIGAGRGTAGGQPVFLLNGRRISGPREIEKFPPEALERTEILPPEAAQQLGYRPEQRVINFVLRRRFRSWSGEVQLGGATQGDRYSGEVEANLVRIANDTRLNVNVEYEAQTAIFEADRDIIPTAPARPYSITGNVSPGAGRTQIDPGLGTLAVAGMPAGITGRPALSAFLPQPNPSDFAAYRTLSPARRELKSTATYARTVLGVDASLNASFETQSSDSQLGLATASLALPATNPFSPFANGVTIDRYLVEGGARQRAVDTNTASVGIALNGDAGRWRWSYTGTYNRGFSRTLTDQSFDLAPLSARLAAGDAAINPFQPFDAVLLGDMRRDYARSINTVVSSDIQANGPIVELPAGPARLSGKAGFELVDLDARAIRSGIASATRTERDTATAQARIDVPIANRGRNVLGALGNLSVNGNLQFDRVSDFGTLKTWGYGANWSPIQQLFLIASVTRDENAPSSAQRGNPLVVTPDVRLFDFVRGESVNVTQIDGGNPNLLTPEVRKTNFQANITPFQGKPINLRVEYTGTRTVNPIANLPAPTAALEAAFPTRFTRDLNGQLIRFDNRPINFDRSDQEQISWGLFFMGRIGPQPPQRQFGGTEGGQRPPGTEGGAPRAGAGQGGQARRFGGPAGGVGGFRGMGPGGGGGRIQVSIDHTIRLTDTITIDPTLPVLDLLGGDAVNTRGGSSRHQIRGRIGGNFKGYGLALSGTWQSGTFVRGGTRTAPTDLEFSPLMTLQLRSFVDFNPSMAAVREHRWLRGTRLFLNVNNLLDARLKVRDASGSVPINYQPDLLDPVGRTFRLGLRKQF